VVVYENLDCDWIFIEKTLLFVYIKGRRGDFMKWTNERITKYVLFGFLGLVISLIVGAATIVLSPFSLLYAVGYLIMLIYLFVVYIKNRPEEAKESLRQMVEICSDPQVVRASRIRHNRKVATKRHRKQIKRSKRRARNLVLLHAANKSIRELMK